ncbi:hypothetical protein OG205_09080 [Lentzea sp. NBC_00516]|uniref:hypothetical protein n=1 Tax=Lentzea sp. NBC_00516 TaxID=2903582 RepID=UPI002E82043D|nr:hypothetical protein [Lentzea sp. NBC_00516]WUD27129.1 hypothetical protein OG205_09080 [Lentzea sp. NBC_00516]
MRFVSVAAVAALALTGLSSGVAHAESAPGCGPVTQIGKTAYIGGNASSAWASVKQFKGCNKNWAYVYVWDSFVDRVGDFQVKVYVEADGQKAGLRTYPRNRQENWSEGTNTLSQCTRAIGQMVDFVSSETYWHTTKTEERC